MLKAVRPLTLIGSLVLAVFATVQAEAQQPKPPTGPGTGSVSLSGPSLPGASDDLRPAVEKALAEGWPDRPEWLDMYTDILFGSQLGPADGWFKRGVVQKRYTWNAVKKKYDRDGNGVISRDEFPGSQGDYQRLDRDHDKMVSQNDFDFTPHALAQSPGAMVFRRLDGDGDGKITRDELEALFIQADSGGQDFLTLGDLQETFPMPGPPRTAPGQPQPANSGPTKETLVRALFRQELGSLQPGLALDQPFVDFTLKTNDGEKEITLSKLIGPKPVVLVFGNFTCGPFRSQGGNVEKLYRNYKDRAEFVMVYVREAHPLNGWHTPTGDKTSVDILQPTTYDERVKVAVSCGERMKLGFPMLVDTIDDKVGAHYSGMPSRLYLFDREGKVAYKSGRGPFGFKPAELEQSLILLLQEPGGNPTSGTETGAKQASVPPR